MCKLMNGERSVIRLIKYRSFIKILYYVNYFQSYVVLVFYINNFCCNIIYFITYVYNKICTIHNNICVIKYVYNTYMIHGYFICIKYTYIFTHFVISCPTERYTRLRQNYKDRIYCRHTDFLSNECTMT